MHKKARLPGMESKALRGTDGLANCWDEMVSPRIIQNKASHLQKVSKKNFKKNELS